MASRSPPPSFLSLPLEIRYLIYEHLLIGDDPACASLSSPTTVQKVAATPDYHLYEPSTSPTSPTIHVLQIRNSTPTPGPNNSRRSWYKIRSDRFRARCMDATYAVSNLPTIHAAILCVSRQIHHEAVPILYSHYTFDFDTHVEACAPFLGDLTPLARSCIRRVGVVKRALPYDKEFDRCEWSNMCRCLQTHLSLAQLSLGIVAGKPGSVGWDGVPRFPKQDFGFMCTRMDEMEWVEHVAGIKGLDRIDIRACVEHCPAPMSSAMGFFVAFSASIEEGFREYLTERMLVKAN